MKKRLALILLGCGLAASAGAVPVRVACIGDSITWGTAMTNRLAECYPTRLQQLLGSGYEVRNFGDPGAGVYEHARRDGRPKAWRMRDEYAKVLAFRPDIIVSNLGINDAVDYMAEIGSDGGSIAPGTFRRQYVSLLESFREGGRTPRLIIWTKLGPCGKGHRLEGLPNAKLMERDLERVAKDVGAETLNMFDPLLPYVETPHFAADGIHPEGLAQTVIAERTAAAIDLNVRIVRCAREGGGCVVLPGGRHFQRGPIRLKSNVELRLEDGAVVEFSDRLADYLPGVPVSWEGVECINVSPLVYAYGCTNIAIAGKGTFKPKLDFWLTWSGTRKPACEEANRRLKNDWAVRGVPVSERRICDLPGAEFRPHFLHFNRCKDVRLEGFAIKGTPFWTIHLLRCDGATVRNLDVNAFDDAGRVLNNSDGVDIERSRNVVVEGCTFRQGDDAIVIKSGLERTLGSAALPCENIVIRGCTVTEGHVLLGIGSEVSCGVRNVLMTNCCVDAAVNRLFFVKTNPRRGGFVENVVMADVKAKEVREDAVAVLTRYFYGQPGEEIVPDPQYTAIRGLTVRNVSVERAKRCVRIAGDIAAPVRDVRIENLSTAEPATADDVYLNAENVFVDGVDRTCEKRERQSADF